MSRKPCPNANEHCKYFFRPVNKQMREQGFENGCFSDLDHIVPQRLGKTALAKAYINLPMNHQQLCRVEHEEKTEDGDEPLPTIESMIGALATAEAEGVVRISKNLRRQLPALPEAA